MNPALYELGEELSREQLIAELAALPDRVRSLSHGLSIDALERRARPDAWSAVDVCKHIRDATQVYGMRFKWMILSDDPLLANYDEDRWVERSPDGGDLVPRLIDEIASYRAETVRLLNALPPEGWSRTGRHEALGTVELEPYVRHQVEHERQHLAQLVTALD
jgi:hypothetical protein